MLKNISPPQKSLSVVKSLYFFFFAGVGAFYTFINVYYLGIGLNGIQIGLINTIGPLVSIFGMVLWGILNDWFGRTRLMMGIAVLGTIIAGLSISTVQSFFWLLPVVCVFSLFNSPISPLLDGTSMSLLGEQGGRYGTLRVWGSFGFILTSMVAGTVYERVGLGVMFWVYAIVMGCFLLASFGLPDRPVHLARSPLSALSQVMRQPVWLLFAASVFVLGLAINGMLSFLSVTIKVMGGSDSLIGISYTVAAISEIPVMLFSAALLSRAGAARLLAVGYFVYFLRMVLFAIMPSPAWVPYINLLNGLSYGLFWVSAVNYANDIAPANLKSTIQSLLFATISLASVAGGVTSGWLFDQVGPAGLFKALALFSLVALILFGLGQLLMRRTRLAVQ